ncbi:hypothetical protein M758_1G060500 [Ceratodon purpureus]|nr:hypothetical protein M758_1G060500 [Ceratodon purpureus]
MFPDHGCKVGFEVSLMATVVHLCMFWVEIDTAEVEKCRRRETCSLSQINGFLCNLY